MSSRDSKRRITIIQVAEACNVSTQTVSRVINNRTDVSAETRQRSAQQRQAVLEELAAGKINADEAITLLHNER